jgi:hypothetical protein
MNQFEVKAMNYQSLSRAEALHMQYEVEEKVCKSFIAGLNLALENYGLSTEDIICLAKAKLIELEILGGFEIKC